MPDLCAYCGMRVYGKGAPEVIADPWCQKTRDHVLPQLVGGKHAGNTVVSCRGCNEIKGSVPVEVFAYFLRKGPRGTIPERKKALASLVFDLTRAGFAAALALHMHRPQAAPEPQARAARPAFVARPPYTLKDLRRSRRFKETTLQ